MTIVPVVTLADLADESPQTRVYSPRLDAVIRRLPKYSRVRVANAIYNAGIYTLAELLARKRADLRRWKSMGKKSIADLEQTLAFFGVHLADAVVPIVVAEQALPIDAHVQQLQRWISARLERCEALPDDAGQAIARAILTDVMLILDGRAPTVDPPGDPVKQIKIKPQTKAQRLANPVWLREQLAELVAECDADIEEDLTMAKETSGDVSTGYSASAQVHRHWKKQLERILAGKTSADELAEVLGGQGAEP